MREVTNFSLMRSNFPLVLNHSPHPMDLGQQKWRSRYKIDGFRKAKFPSQSWASASLALCFHSGSGDEHEVSRLARITGDVRVGE